MLTTRDLDVVDFISEFKIARTSTIQQLFFPSVRVANRRLDRLVEAKELNRIRDSLTTEYLYYKARPRQLKHSLLVTDFYREMSKVVKVHHFKAEADIGGVRPDAVIAYETNGKKYIACLEVELSNKGFDILKYELLFRNGDYKRVFPVFPQIIAVTAQKVSSTDLTVIQINIDLTNIDRLKGGV